MQRDTIKPQIEGNSDAAATHMNLENIMLCEISQV